MDLEKLTGPELEKLIEKISRAEEELEQYIGPGVDAILDPVRSAPVFLRHANQSLRESESRYRRLLENLSALVLEMRPDGTIQWVNEAVCTRTGIEREQLTGRKWGELFIPDSGSDFLEKIHQSWTQGDIRHLEETFQANGSGAIVLDLSSANRYDENGSLERIVLLGTDITERRQAQAAREKAHAELQTVLSSMVDAVVVYNGDGQIVQMNEAAASMLIYSDQDRMSTLSERLDKTRIEDSEGGTIERGEIPVNAALQGETVRGRLLAYNRPGRPPLHVSASAAPIHNPTGEVVGAVVSMADITELRKLQHQQSMYAHTISHDLRTPLTAIRGHADLLEMTRDRNDDSQNKSIDAILRASEQMEMMIHDLVDMARLEGGELRLEQKALNLDTFLRRFIETVGPGLAMERLDLHVPAELPPVFADPERLERILTNLITNALKYSPAEEPVNIHVERSGEMIEVLIRDRGKGISSKDLPQIFKPFQQADQQDYSDSVGLGLYITRMLVRAHQGEISAESELDKGTTFRFTLPLS